MPARRFDTLEEFCAEAGTTLGVSAWHRIDQALIDEFAQTTLDRQWLHTHLERATAGPFGAPVAHGFLTLSLVPAMLSEVFQITEVDYTVNKAVRAVRFPAPVVAGSRVRASVILSSARARPRGFWEAVLAAVVEREHEADPGCVAELTFLLSTNRSADASPS
jgi:acyl dehydratase